MVIIFCGVPGVGKSTIARKLVDELEKLGQVRLFVSDLISGQVYKKVFKFLKENVDEADYLLVDATFYKKEYREIVKKMVGKENLFVVYLHCSVKTCLERDEQREPSVGKKAIYIIAAEMERPKRPNVLIDTDKVEPEKAVKQILDKLTKKEVK